MDKPSKVKNFTNTMSDNINAYNSFIEENLGIPVGVQTGLRIGASAYTLGTGGSLVAAAGPFAFPILFGGALKKKERERIERITDQDTQGDNKTPIDMMTYDIPAYGDPGFNIHNDKKDQSDRTPQGPSNQQQSDFGYESDYGFI